VAVGVAMATSSSQRTAGRTRSDSVLWIDTELSSCLSSGVDNIHSAWGLLVPARSPARVLAVIS
jgi:hypothetical protein